MPNSDLQTRVAWPIDDIRRALLFLTRLPMPRLADTERPLMRAAWCFPLVGLVVAAFGCLVAWFGHALGLPALVTALLVLTATALVTGALHEDGLADLADGFGGGRDREHVITIMRDSRIGAYGVLGLVLVTGIKAAALAALLAAGLQAAILALIVAHVLARAAMVPIAGSLPHASESGLAQSAGRPGTTAMVFAVTIAALVSLLLMPAKPALAAVSAAVLVAVIVAWLAKRRIGGYTGDVLGGAEQIAEAAILAILSGLLATA